MRLAAAESWRAGDWADVIDEPMYWSVQGALIAIVSGIALLRYVLHGPSHELRLTVCLR